MCTTSAAYTVKSVQFLGDYSCPRVACDSYSRRICLSCPMVMDEAEFVIEVSPMALNPTYVLTGDNMVVLTCQNVLLIQI